MQESELEIYYDITVFISSIVTKAFSGYCYSYFVTPFMRRRKHVFLVGTVYFACMMFLRYIPLVLDHTLAYVIGVCAGFAVMWLLDRNNLAQKIFLSVTFFSLRWMSSSLANHLNNRLTHLSYQIPGFYGNYPFQYQIFVVLLVLNDVLWFLLLFSAVRIIQRAYLYKYEPMSKKELLLLLVPSLSALVSYKMLDQLDTAYVDVAGWYFQDMDSTYDWHYILFSAVSFISVLAVILIFQDMKNHQREERQNELLSRQIADMEIHIAKVERFYRDMRGLRHDLGNHIMTLEHLYAEGEREEAEHYIDGLKNELEGELHSGALMKTGNPVTDVILTEWQETAAERGIAFESSFHFPKGTAVNAFDVSIILNNALENALEGIAGCRNPCVCITSHRRNQAYLIEIVNDTATERRLEEENGLPVSTKSESTGHGLGLANIRRVAQKYNGDIEIRQEQGQFALTILLMLNS